MPPIDTYHNSKIKDSMKTVIMSTAAMNQGDNLEEIYAWIDGIPFSRPKKNLPRDFSDGVLMAEMLKVHYPRFVDVHNYIPASSVASKRDNWCTLNRKVFAKIDMKLSKEVINQLANAQQGVIEKLLIDLRQKILLGDENSVKTEQKPEIENEDAENISKTVENIDRQEIEEASEPSKVLKGASVVNGNTNLIGKACGWVSGWIWPSSVPPKEAPVSQVSGVLEEESGVSTVAKFVDEEDEESSSISRLDFLLLREEVEEKNAAISMLNRKVCCLESVMKLKDQKIVNLAARISAPIEAAQNLRPHVMGSSISRLRYQTKSKR